MRFAGKEAVMEKDVDEKVKSRGEVNSSKLVAPHLFIEMLVFLRLFNESCLDSGFE